MEGSAMEMSKGEKQRKGRVCEMGLRVLGLVFTLVAAVLLGVNKQTKLVSIPPFSVPVTAKYHYLSAFVYFVVVNAIACGYAGISIVVAGLANRGGRSRGLEAVMRVMDAAVVGLLFSGNGATIALGVIGFQGNSHVQWQKVCNIFSKFCNQVAAASALSLLGSIAFLLLLLLPALRAT